MLAAISMIVILSFYVTNVVINNQLESEDPIRIKIHEHHDHPWGHIYPSRVWCSVLTIWPDRREHIESVIETWAPLCDTLVFVVDDSSTKPPSENENDENDERKPPWEPAPESYLGFDFLRLSLDTPQSIDWRNIWEKSWKAWLYVGTHHLNDSEWFLKIDDDTFFSPINFKGFARYLNPNESWYIGHTLLHSWKRGNVVFNGGSCYALSRGALARLVDIFESESFLNPSTLRKREGRRCNFKCLCVPRPGAWEDVTMSVCLHSIGIDPLNTLDEQYKERFFPFKESSTSSSTRRGRDDDFWYFQLKPVDGMNESHTFCCSQHPISFHSYKTSPMASFKALHRKYNIEEGVNGKAFDVPAFPRSFLHRKLDFPTDEWRNSIETRAVGQLVYKGPGKERVCWHCDG